MNLKMLLGRPLSAEYTKECTEEIAKEKSSQAPVVEASVVIFRLGKEWLALSTQVFSEIGEARSVHSLPLRKGKGFLGVTNVRGQLKLCVSLHDFLEIDGLGDKKVFDLFIVIKQKEDTWVFPVDEIFGIHHFELVELFNVPVTVSKSTVNYLKGILRWEKKEVGYLDEDLLFQSLRRSLL